MTAADNATAKPARKRISTTAKVFWILLALLFVVVAGFVFSAWRELNRITPPVANPADSTQQVEVLTPTGASQNVPTFVPGKNNTVATASAPAATAAPGTTARPDPPRESKTLHHLRLRSQSATQRETRLHFGRPSIPLVKLD